MNARQRKTQIRQQQNRREKRRKLRTLTPEEWARVNEVKRNQHVYVKESRAGRGCFTCRTLSAVNEAHEKDFAAIVESISKRFPNQTIEVLDEGSGESTFFKELPEKLKEKCAVNVTRTDIDPEIQSTQQSQVVHCNPEELFKRFGADRFHLAVTTFGGTNYTVGSQAKAIANIISVLKPGGEASILLSDAPKVFTGAKVPSLTDLEKILKRFKNVQIAKKEKWYEEDRFSHRMFLTIKKLRNPRQKQ